MEIQNIFFGVAIFFLFILLGYIVYEYLGDVASQIKAVLSFILAIILFVIGDLLRRRDI